MNNINNDAWEDFIYNEVKNPGENFSCYNCKKLEKCKHPIFEYICENYIKRT